MFAIQAMYDISNARNVLIGLKDYDKYDVESIPPKT